ncbi:ABC transporter permease [Sphaerisporangium corydalis]|uniref:ABC transporter permease n=1 Tax=Sphaerisporangium corydalis TaxID=1441875 RepID=A0ABV9E8W1_9ACTN|nr:ABC transporter permease [Sphaerisporangium corydalis]
MSTVETSATTAPADGPPGPSAQDPGREPEPRAAQDMERPAGEGAGRDTEPRAYQDAGRDTEPRAGQGAGTGKGAARGQGAGAVAVRRRGPGRAALRMLGSELGLTFRRPRNIAMLVVLAFVPVLIGVVLRVVGGDDDAPSIITQVAGNGLMLTFAALTLLVQLLLPLAVSVVAGDAIAGEANGGTLRYLLTAPAGRGRLLAVKFANVSVFALAACSVVAVAALVTGSILFPVGPVTLLSGSTIPLADGLLRVLIVTGYSAAGMAALGTVGLAISTLTEVPIGAVAGTMVTVVFSQVFGLIPQLEPLRPWLLTSWWSSFDGALRDPIAADVMVQGLLVFGAYALIFGSIAWARFSGRDITS